MLDYREAQSEPIDRALEAGEALRRATDELLDGVAPYPGPRTGAAFAMATISVEHGDGFRTLVASGLPSAAMPMLRIQFEALTRSLWIHYAASDEDVQTITELVTEESLARSRRFVLPPDMITALRANPLSKQAAVLLQRFSDSSRKPLNSFVHAEILALQRHVAGYPEEMVEQLLKMSNSLTMMAVMSLALLTGRPDLKQAATEMQHRFAHGFTEPVPFSEAEKL